MQPAVQSTVSCLRVLTWVGVCLLSLATTDADAKFGSATAPASSPVRSAQMFARDVGWRGVVPRSAEAERAEIRAHFAEVRRILHRDTPRSLDIAVARFEQGLDEPLTPSGRGWLRTTLAARRAAQLNRLGAYERAGTFPLNHHYAGEARPIFVDARGTHCAVGHLMALDGWEGQVQAIARRTPNVLVRDVNDGPLVSWVLTSGLIQSEAALIQPAYFPPPSAGAVRLSDLILPGASLDRDGFRYENFAFTAAAAGGAPVPTAAQLGLVYGWPPVATSPGELCMGYSGNCVQRPDTLWFGVYENASNFGYLRAPANQMISMDIAYDVVALGPGLAIGGTETLVPYSLYGGFLGGFPDSTPTPTVTTSLDDDALGRLVIDVPAFYSEVSESLLLDEPVERMRVKHSIQFANGSMFGSFDSTVLRAVPAPGTFGLLAFGLALIGRYARRPGSRVTGAVNGG